MPRQVPPTTAQGQSLGQVQGQSLGQVQGQSPDIGETSGQGLGQVQGQSPSIKRLVNPAIIGGMFQRIQNVTGCGSCGGAV